MPLVQIGQVFLRERGALGQLLRAAVCNLAHQQTLQTLEGIAFHDTQLVVQVQAVALQFLIDDRLGALVTHHAFTREDLHVDHGTAHARRHAQRGVLHVGRLLTEDRTQQLLFRRQLGLALGRDLADHHVAGFHFCADVRDARFVQASQLCFGQVRDVARDFFRSELGVASNDRQLLDVDRGVAVFSHDALRDQDRILEVVAVPGHERDQHVLAERQLAHVGRGAVSNHVAAGNNVAHLDHRTLVDVRVLVRTRVLDQVVDVHADFTGDGFGIVYADHHTVRVNVVDHAATGCLHGGTRVHCHGALDAGTHQRLVRTQAGHGLTLHVCAHQCTVCIIVLEERHQRGCGRHDLRRRHVDVLHAVRRDHTGFTLAAFTCGDQLVNQVAGFVHRRVGLRHHVLAFLDGRQVVDLVGQLAVFNLAVRRLEEAVVVQLCVQCQRVDQTNVRTFRRFDRTHAAIVGRVHVTDFKARALARQAARAQCRNTTLVRDFRQRVGLVHELRQLRRTEELANRRRNRLRVDQVVRHQVFRLSLAQTFLHGAFNTRQPGTELVFCQFADAAHTAIAEVVDIVDFALAVTQVHQQLDRVEDVLVGQHHRAGTARAVQAAVDLHAANTRQVVRVFAIEQTLEQCFNGVFGRRLAGAHHAVDGDTRGGLVGGVVRAQRRRHVRTLIQVVRVQRLDFLHAGVTQLLEHAFGQFVVGVGQDFTGVRVDDVLRQHAAQQVVFRHADQLGARGIQVADVLGVDALVLLDHDLAVLVGNVEASDFTAQTLGHEFHQCAFRLEREVIEHEEVRQDLFRRQADRL